ncbi:MAG: hypothetical protein IBJ00_08195, partial [Alphaproteobacteria bacterium]|nr:hypothetical protein [Alphaproteobacteria bacterium]
MKLNFNPFINFSSHILSSTSPCVTFPSQGYTNLGARFSCFPGASFFWGMCAFICCLGGFDAWAVTDAELTEEITKGEKFITGGYLRLGLLAGCGVAGIIAMFKQSVMGMLIAGGAALFVFLINGWIKTNFAALI